jgi:hypothetical protein
LRVTIDFLQRLAAQVAEVGQVSDLPESGRRPARRRAKRDRSAAKRPAFSR